MTYKCMMEAAHVCTFLTFRISPVYHWNGQRFKAWIRFVSCTSELCTKGALTELVAGSFSTVYKGIERDTKKVWAVKTMLKSNIKRDEEENLKVLLKCFA